MKPGDKVMRKHCGTSIFLVRDVGENDHGETVLVLEGFQELGWVEADIFEKMPRRRANPKGKKGAAP